MLTKTDVAVGGLVLAIVIGSSFEQTQKPALVVGGIFSFIVWVSAYQSGVLQRAVEGIH